MSQWRNTILDWTYVFITFMQDFYLLLHSGRLSYLRHYFWKQEFCLFVQTGQAVSAEVGYIWICEVGSEMLNFSHQDTETIRIQGLTCFKTMTHPDADPNIVRLVTHPS